MNTQCKVVYEFGPFRLDPEIRVLVRDDEAIALTPKVFDTLLVLVRRSREVVTKDELLNEIWPDSFVEEANLTQNIFTLRKALGDGPGERRYIVTIPGRGYKFAAPVTTVSGEALIAQVRSRTEILIEESETEPAALAPRHKTLGQWRTAAVFLSIAFIVGVGGILLIRHRPPTVVQQKNSVLIAQFTNFTGDPIFDNTLRQGLEVQLAQSPYLAIVPAGRIQQALRLMEKKPDTQVSGELAREICIRTGTAGMLEGSIQSVGRQYLLTVRASYCGNGELIAEEQGQVSGKENVLGALSGMSSKVRERVGESRATLQKHDVPIAEATTSSLEALQAYSLGMQTVARKGDEAAIPFFKRAVEKDPKFAMAYAWLGLQYGSSGSSELATENIKKAYELREGVSENELFFISAYYFGRGTGNQEKARQVCEAWAQTYPKDPIPHGFLSGFIYRVLANYDKAIEEARRLVALYPDASFAYDQLAVDFTACWKVGGERRNTATGVSKASRASPFSAASIRYGIHEA